MGDLPGSLLPSIWPALDIAYWWWKKEHFGGQITNTSEVVNYPGVEKTTGVALTDIMRKQAQSFGAEFLLAAVDQLDMTAAIKTVFTSRGRFFLLWRATCHRRSSTYGGI